jgi:hypothetical protein
MQLRISHLVFTLIGAGRTQAGWPRLPAMRVAATFLGIALTVNGLLGLVILSVLLLRSKAQHDGLTRAKEREERWYPLR